MIAHRHSSTAVLELALTQPLLPVAGSDAGSLWHSQELHGKSASTDKELFIVKGATHMDLYGGKSMCPGYGKVERILR